jgi:hypothetical protein
MFAGGVAKQFLCTAMATVYAVVKMAKAAKYAAADLQKQLYTPACCCTAIKQTALPGGLIEHSVPKQVCIANHNTGRPPPFLPVPIIL